MKKLFVVLAALAVANFAHASASTTNTITNAVGQVSMVVTGDNGTGISSTTDSRHPAALPFTQTSQPGVQIDTNVVGTATTLAHYTPRDYGDILIGQMTGSTQTVWIAHGTATSDWVRVGN